MGEQVEFLVSADFDIFWVEFEWERAYELEEHWNKSALDLFLPIPSLPYLSHTQEREKT